MAGIEQDLYQAQERKRTEENRQILEANQRFLDNLAWEQENRRRSEESQRAREAKIRALDEQKRAEKAARKRKQTERDLAREAEALRRKAEKAGVSLPLTGHPPSSPARPAKKKALAFWFWGIVGFSISFALLPRWRPGVDAGVLWIVSLVTGVLLGVYWRPIVGLSIFSALAFYVFSGAR